MPSNILICSFRQFILNSNSDNITCSLAFLAYLRDTFPLLHLPLCPSEFHLHTFDEEFNLTPKR